MGYRRRGIIVRVLFIRHAAAEDKPPFSGEDMARPLTSQGRADAEAMFKSLARIYDKVNAIITSEAVRARQTAGILANSLASARIVVTRHLNPGSDFKAFRKALSAAGDAQGPVAVVGHEPDLGRIIGQAVGTAALRIDVKKLCCVEVDMNTLGKGELKLVLPPAAAEALRR
ncbi:MAG: histidine phosphatase family protein [Verrucomicrobiota bacterium]